MKKFRGIGAAGLSLVELIISMAILAVVGTAVGGAMYVSSRSYTRGAAEVNVQEEAQVAANLICDWIIDATDVNSDGHGGFVEGSSTRLVIVHPDGDKKIEITVEQSGTELVYVAKDVTDSGDPSYGSTVGSGILAKNVTGVQFYSTFATDRNVKISIDFNVNDRTYRAVTDSTSRSHDFVSTSGTSVLGAPALHFELVSNDGGAHVTLEPGQNSSATEYYFYAVVDGCDADTVTFNQPSEPAGACTEIVGFSRVTGTNMWKVTVRSDSDADHDDTYNFTVSNAGGSDTKPLTIRIRRVNDCSFDYYSTDATTGKHIWNPASGSPGAAGTRYENTISLNATNWQEELSIAGANETEKGFDASPWNYVNPTDLQVKFMTWSEGGHTWVPSAAIGTYTITSGANPTISVTLNQEISYPIACIISAPHSGSFAGNHSIASDPYCGTSCTVNNKTGVTYGDGGHAYYDIIWINDGTHNHIDNVGAGIRRGVPACMVAEYDSEFKNQLLHDIKEHMGWTQDTQVQWDNGSHIRYSVTLEYRPLDPYTGLGTGAYEKVVVANVTNFDQIFSDFVTRRLRDSSSSIFKLNLGYEVKYNFNVYIDGTKWKTYPATGSVCAATPYVYDPNRVAGDTVNFKNGEYTFTHPLGLTGTGTQSFGLFVDGIMMNNQKVQFKCQYWDTTSNSWKAADNVIAISGTEWTEGATTVGGVYYDHVHLSDGRTYQVGPYDENEPSANNLRTNLQFFDIKKDQMTSGVIYRVVFDTDWKEMSNISRGVENGGQNDVVKCTNEVTNHYTLNGDFYFTI